MTKVLILSDSHGLTDELTVIKERHQLELMIHCGDSELEMDAKELVGFYKVAGNCDYDVRYPNEQTIELDGVTFYITHGHLHNVKQNLLGISHRAEEEKAQVICFGHTHIAGAEQVGMQLLINPGSIRLPRNRAEKTYAIMEWENPSAITVDFYTVTGKKVEGLTTQASL
ncbi:metallophosphoesterase [Oceanobacillus rekensis]|uniref:metallophosphoesterase n=1 Tax=Oceanobacillus rekensis TaxID=937927 RepID=UPI000B43CCD2|nr:metallophosphoesterase [Oceanobacillus rekensis]